MHFIDLQSQYCAYRSEIDRAIREVLESGHYILGKQVQELEEQLAKYVGAAHCIGTSSGTDSLILALLALEIGPGDEVITVPFSWVATAEAVRVVGARPVFVDLDPETYCLDARALRKAITPRTRAILPVSLFGQPSDHRAIQAIAEEHGIPVIEDAAQSFGSTHHGKKSCNLSEIGVTSFFPTKPLGAYGDAGAVFVNSDALAEKLRALRIHGQHTRHHHEYIARNARIDTLQAAIILAKLPHFDKELARRQEIAERYTQALKDLCRTPSVAPGNTHVYAQYTIQLADRDHVSEGLKARGIPSAVYYPKCIHEQPAYRDLGYFYGSLPVAERASREVLSLPMHPWLTEAEQNLVINALVETLSLASSETRRA